MIAFKLPPLDEFKGKNEVSTVSLPLLFAVTLSIITSNIYTRLAACNCISITFWSGDLPSPLMAIFYILIFATNSGKYQNIEKPLKHQRRLGLSWPVQHFVRPDPPTPSIPGLVTDIQVNVYIMLLWSLHSRD